MSAKRKQLKRRDRSPHQMKREASGDAWCYIDEDGAIRVYDEYGVVGKIMPKTIRRAAIYLPRKKRVP